MNNFYDDLNAFTQRVNFVVQKIGTQAEAARQVGVTDASIKRWITGQSDPSRINLIKLAQASGVQIEWLATGKGEPFPEPQAEKKQLPQIATNYEAIDTLGNPIDLDDFVFIPYYNINLSAGHGSWVENEQPVSALAFRRKWLSYNVTSRFHELSAVKVTGDSMQGVLNDKDTILINHTQTDARDGLYAIRIGEDVFVKRVQRLLNKLLITSSNPEYAPFEVPLNEDSEYHVEIIGKVVWVSRAI